MMKLVKKKTNALSYKVKKKLHCTESHFKNIVISGY